MKWDSCHQRMWDQKSFHFILFPFKNIEVNSSRSLIKKHCRNEKLIVKVKKIAKKEKPLSM